MGKKRRYKLKERKFGRKYALKYGLGNTTETPTNVTNATPEPVIMAAPELIVEEIVVALPESTTAVTTADPIVEALEAAPKKKAAPKKRTKAATKVKAETKKSTTTTRKTTRKRTTKAKTTT